MDDIQSSNGVTFAASSEKSASSPDSLIQSTNPKKFNFLKFRIRLTKRILPIIFMGIATALITIIGVIVYLYIKESNVKIKNIRISNISDGSATISWVSDRKAKGVVYYGEKDSWFPVFTFLGKEREDDDRDVRFNKDGDEVLLPGGRKKYFTHHVTVENLNPNTRYFFRIGTGVIKGFDSDVDGNKVKPIETAPVIESLATPDPAYGRVFRPDGSPVADALLYFTLKNNESDKSTIISTSTSEKGTWSIDLGNARTLDMTERFELSDKGSEVISVQGASDGVAEVSVDTNQDQPTPDVVLRNPVDGYKADSSLVFSVYAVGSNENEDSTPLNQEGTAISTTASDPNSENFCQFTSQSKCNAFCGNGKKGKLNSSSCTVGSNCECYEAGNKSSSGNNQGTNKNPITDVAIPLPLCGNGVCDSTENSLNCSEDCSKACAPEGNLANSINYGECCSGLSETKSGICLDCNKSTDEECSVLGTSDDIYQLQVNEGGKYVLLSDQFPGGVKEVKMFVPEGGKGTFRFFYDKNSNNKKDADEDFVSEDLQIQIELKESLTRYELSDGWNLIGLNLFPSDGEGRSAKEILESANSQGGFITHVATYRDGQFLIYTQRGGIEFGNDFNILPGEAYFLRSHDTSDFDVTGNKFIEPVPVDLANGWNLISIVKPNIVLTAEGALDSMTLQGINADAFSRYQSGLYTSIIKQNGELFGRDFNVIETNGYFIRVKDGAKRWTP